MGFHISFGNKLPFVLIVGEVDGHLLCAKNWTTLEEKPLYLKYCWTVSTLSAEALGDRSGTCGSVDASEGPFTMEDVGVILLTPATGPETTPSMARMELSE